MLTFVWDNAKASSNVTKHQVRFDYAARAFLDNHRIVIQDSKRDYGEVRYITYALIEKRVFVVSYTMRGQDIRLISARKGNDREQKRYHSVRTES